MTINSWAGLVADTRPRRKRIKDDAEILWGLWRWRRKGQPLPTMYEMAVELGWPHNSVEAGRRIRTAYKRLADRGYIEMRLIPFPGKPGAFIRRHFKKERPCK